MDDLPFLPGGPNDPEPAEYNRAFDWNRHIPNDVEPMDLPLYDLSGKAEWTISSCKTDGYGINELLHDSAEKMWQTNGKQPHTLTIEFQKRTAVCFLFLYLDFKNDNSYTPRQIGVGMGSSELFLREPRIGVNFNEPQGWQCVDLRTNNRPSKVFVVQLQVLHNHQNGRDSHIRHIRIVGPGKPRCRPQYLNSAEFSVKHEEDVDDNNHQSLYKNYDIR